MGASWRDDPRQRLCLSQDQTRGDSHRHNEGIALPPIRRLLIEDVESFTLRLEILASIVGWVAARPKAIWNQCVNPDQIRRELQLRNDLAEEAVHAARLKNAKTEIDLRVYAARKKGELQRLKSLPPRPGRRRLPPAS